MAVNIEMDEIAHRGLTGDSNPVYEDVENGEETRYICTSNLVATFSLHSSTFFSM